MARRTSAGIPRHAWRPVVAAVLMTLLACDRPASGPGHATSQPVAEAKASQAYVAYPTHALRLVIPFAAGGGADRWGRFVAAKLGEQLGQPFAIENVPGRGGNDGTEVTSKAAGDGYTLLLGSTGPLVVHAWTYDHLPFDAEKDFVPVGLIESSPLLLVVHADVKATSLQELLALAKADPGQLSFATNGNGSPEQVAGELFERLAQVSLRDVPYDGAGPARKDLSKGHVTMMFDVCKAAMGAVQERRQRPLAVADGDRAKRLPGVPTLTELGFPEIRMRIWTGLFAPRGTPSVVVETLNAALRRVLEDGDVRRTIEDVGGEPMPMSPEEVAGFLAAERAHWQQLVRDSGVSRVNGPL
ncbi:MAG TPA: tripartite tricarboxylate transporter substrate binding protein [Polyangiaceae bacterium]